MKIKAISMERIFFDEDQKDILQSLNKGIDVDSFKEIWGRSRWHYAIEYLIECRLVDAAYYDDMDYTNVRLTNLGKEYLSFNPKLKNPLSEKASAINRFWSGIYGRVISYVITWLLGALMGYIITDECPDNKKQKMDEPIVEIQSHNSNVVVDTIIVDKEQATDFPK